MSIYEEKKKNAINNFEGVVRIIELISNLETSEQDYHSVTDKTDNSYISYDSIIMFLNLLDNNELLQMDKSYVTYSYKDDRKSLFSIFINLCNEKLIQLDFSIGKKQGKVYKEIYDEYIGQYSHDDDNLECQINAVIGRSNREGFVLDYSDCFECAIRFIGHQVCVGDTNSNYHKSFTPFFDYRKFDGKNIFDILNPVSSSELLLRAKEEAIDLYDEIEILYSPEYEESLPKVNKLR